MIKIHYSEKANSIMCIVCMKQGRCESKIIMDNLSIVENPGKLFSCWFWFPVE